MTKQLSWCASMIVIAIGLAAPAAAQPLPGTPQQLDQLIAEVAQLREAVMRQAESVRPRRFYLTKDTFNGSQPLNACAAGFHMASLWEILDVTSLKYDTTLGLTTADSGDGPPSAVDTRGWIRTGNVSRAAEPDLGTLNNCGTWTESAAPSTGAVAQLKTGWTGGFEIAAATNHERIEPPIIPWFAYGGSCGENQRVWCVQDR